MVMIPLLLLKATRRSVTRVIFYSRFQVHWANLCFAYPRESYQKHVPLLLFRWSYICSILMKFVSSLGSRHDHNLGCTVCLRGSHFRVGISFPGSFLLIGGILSKCYHLSVDSQLEMFHRKWWSGGSEGSSKEWSEWVKLSAHTYTTQKWHMAIFRVKNYEKERPGSGEVIFIQEQE